MSRCFKSLSNLDDVAIRIDMHVARAMFIGEAAIGEIDDIDIDACEDWQARLTLKRAAEYFNIIFDYLGMIADESKELQEIAKKLFCQYKECNNIKNEN